MFVLILSVPVSHKHGVCCD